MYESNFSVEELAALNSIGYQTGSLESHEDIGDFMDRLSYGPLEFALEIRDLFENSKGILHLIDLEINKRKINGRAREVLYRVWRYLYREDFIRKKYNKKLSREDILKAFSRYSETKGL